jgi:tetratricopeptide (TPR) repeat protein
MRSLTRGWRSARVIILDLVVGLIFVAGTSAPLEAAYVVNDIALGSRVATNSAAYRAYRCAPSEDFAELTWCTQSQQTSSRGRTITTVKTLVHAPDGTALYLMANAATVTHTKRAVEAEIARLSRQIGAQPNEVQWFEDIQGAVHSVLVSWGRVKLEELKGDAVAPLAEGKSPKQGVLIDTLGDLQRSAQSTEFPVYRVATGSGYLYAASFDRRGNGHTHYVAIEGTPLTTRYFERSLQRLIERDRALAANDYSLWPEVARITRRLARDISVKTANDLLDKGFERSGTRKLHSHVWASLPGGVIEHMAIHQYGVIDIYGANGERPEIRRSIQQFIAAHPSEPFIEFMHYAVGDFDKALKSNPNSPIADVLHYALGHKLLALVLRDASKAVDPGAEEQKDDPPALFGSPLFPQTIGGQVNNKLLINSFPSFAARVAVVQPHFEFLLRDPAARHADDAAFMLGWIALQLGKEKEALGHLSKAMELGNRDYRHLAVVQTLQVLQSHSAREMLAIVEGDRNFVRQPALWYVTARTAYRDHDYPLAINAAERALKAMSVPIDALPATTDPDIIREALEKINRDLLDDNILEIPYLLEASREIVKYEASLKGSEPPDAIIRRARAIILKYSKLVDDQEPHNRKNDASKLAHHDLRQALYLIDLTLAGLAQKEPFARLREWVHYRKIRVLVAFDPKAVPAAVAAMERDVPDSRLLDDALAEQIVAEGIRLRDIDAAQATFRKIVGTFPRGNAIDNAYTWMAIIMRCEGRKEEADKLNREILARFPGTRHAAYAKERIEKPDSCGIDDSMRVQ